MSLTIYDIAEKANVSIATVSRAMNPKTREKVSAKTLEEIDRIIKKFHYAPNISARNLTSRFYQTLGVLLPHGPGIFQSDYYSKILSGISDYLLDSDFKFKLLFLKPGAEDWDKHNFHIAEGVDGLIVTHWHSFFKSKKAFENINIPCVVISDPEKGMKTFNVSGDHEQGGALAAEHLVSHGHKKLAVLVGPKDSSDSQARLRGFEKKLKALDMQLDPELIFNGEFQEGIAYKLSEKIAKMKNKISGIFCCNDEMAFGLIRGLKEQGMKCPKDISVVGFDDHSRSESFEVPLTSIRVPLEKISQRGTELLVEGIEKGVGFKDMKFESLLIPLELVERKSVKRET